MKEQITTWLFLLLLGSGYNIESVQGQNVINEFPYELSPESYSKWTLEEGYDWIVTSSMGKPVYGLGEENLTPMPSHHFLIFHRSINRK